MIKTKSIDQSDRAGRLKIKGSSSDHSKIHDEQRNTHNIYQLLEADEDETPALFINPYNLESRLTDQAEIEMITPKLRADTQASIAKPKIVIRSKSTTDIKKPLTSPKALVITPTPISPKEFTVDFIRHYMSDLIQINDHTELNARFKKLLPFDLAFTINLLSLATVINRALQELFKLKNPEKTVAVFRSLIETGLIQKMLPILDDCKKLDRQSIAPDYTETMIDMAISASLPVSEHKGVSALNYFYRRFLDIIDNEDSRHGKLLRDSALLKAFYAPIHGYAKHCKSSILMHHWLSNSMLLPSCVIDNLNRLIEEDIIDKIFPGFTAMVMPYQKAFFEVMHQIENKTWRLDSYWASRYSTRFDVNVLHLIYAHIIVCSHDLSKDTRHVLTNIIEQNDLFKQSFNRYKIELNCYYNIFKTAFSNIHGVEKPNPFINLENNLLAERTDKRKSVFHFFFQSPTCMTTVASNNDWRAKAHGHKAFTP